MKGEKSELPLFPLIQTTSAGGEGDVSWKKEKLDEKKQDVLHLNGGFCAVGLGHS